MSISAVIVALAAIAVSIWQGMDNRRHNRLSVKPKLDITFKSSKEEAARIVVSNNGLGPATIKNFDIEFNNQLLDESPIAALLTLSTKLGLDSIPFSFDLIEGATIRAGEQLSIFAIIQSDNLEEIHKSLIIQINNIDLLIEYESMYGEEFLAKF